MVVGFELYPYFRDQIKGLDVGRGVVRGTEESGMILSTQENGGTIAEMQKIWRFGDEGQVELRIVLDVLSYRFTRDHRETRSDPNV